MSDDRQEPEPPKLGSRLAESYLALKKSGLALGRWLRRNYDWLVVVIGGLGFVGIALPALWSLRGVVLGTVDALGAEIGAHGTEGFSGDDFRNLAYTAGALLGGIALLAAIPFQLIKTWVNERQARTAEEGHITDRLTRAIEQLGAEKTQKVEEYVGPRDPETGKFQREVKTLERTVPNIEVRLGAIYALERIAEDSERDHIPIMETLCAYIRENASPGPAEDFPEGDLTHKHDMALPDYLALIEARRSKLREHFGPAKPLRADIQAVFTVIARRFDGPKGAERKKLEEAKGFRLDLRRANLQRLDLTGVDLTGALLTHARLEGADLFEARLEGAKLHGARLEGANISLARLEGAILGGAGLEGADLGGARLEGADLRLARLEGANLHEARLESTDLAGWSCARSRARSADFTEAKNLSAESVNSLFGVKSGEYATKLPAGMDPPAHWHESDDWDAYEADYERWLAAGCPTGADWRDGA